MTPLLRGDLALRNLHISGSGWATVIKFRQQLQLLVWKWWATLLQVLMTSLLLDHVTLKKLLSSLWRSCSFKIWTSDAACGESEWTLLLRSWRCLCCMVKRYWHSFISRVKISFIKFGQLIHFLERIPCGILFHLLVKLLLHVHATLTNFINISSHGWTMVMKFGQQIQLLDGNSLCTSPRCLWHPYCAHATLAVLIGQLVYMDTSLWKILREQFFSCWCRHFYVVTLWQT